MSEENVQLVRQMWQAFLRNDSELYRLRAGKITYRKGFSNPEQALAEAGLTR